MRTEIEKLKDEVFLEAKKRCEEFKAESYDHTLKFIDDLINYIRRKEVISESDLFRLIDESINPREIELCKDNLETLSSQINVAPFWFKDYLSWKK